MINYKRTSSDDPDFTGLVALLDTFLAEIDGEEHSFYAQLNKTATLKNVVVCYDGDKAVGCGAFRPYEEDKVEIKRMYVLPGYRGRAIGYGVLKALEDWAAELNYNTCILETGKRQPEAISLYQKAGYGLIPNYGKYQTVENSVCFSKKIRR